MSHRSGKTTAMSLFTDGLSGGDPFEDQIGIHLRYKIIDNIVLMLIFPDYQCFTFLKCLISILRQWKCPYCI